MMRKINCFLTFVLFSAIMLASCTISHKPIDYGQVACHYCSMTIVDKQHAAQIVTDKGKIFNYDAVECMVNQLNEPDAPAASLYLVNDYNSPGKLIDATQATYLISEGIPSPMGEFLTGFNTKTDAEAALQIHGGDLYNWNELKEKFKSK